MQTIAGIMPQIEDQLESAKAGARALREAAIAAGVHKYGWPADAQCPICGDTGRIPPSGRTCQCPAGKAAEILGREAAAKAEWERRWQLSGVPRRFRELRIETSPNQIAAALVEAWIERRPWAIGENLILTGAVGTGKTGLAIGALWRIHEVDVVGAPLFIGCSDFLDMLRPGGPEGAMVAAQKAGVLVIDDLGTSRGTEWEQERLYVLVNARYESELSTIVTTNVTPPELAASLGQRTVSRLMEIAELVSVDGPDLRRIGGGR